MNVEETESVTEIALAEAEPLPVLFSHKCCDAAHALYEELRNYFAEEGLALKQDPFVVGENVLVSMKRLHIHGVMFHVTPESIVSEPVKTELATARRIHVPIVPLADGASVPEDLRNRIYPNLPGLSGKPRTEAFRTLAQQMRSRARVHTVLDWLRQRERTVEERESGVRWLHDQPAQVLAEFFELIVSLHQGKNEDNIVCRWLAQVLVRTGLADACSHLHDWWLTSDHPNSRYGLEQAMDALRCPLPSKTAATHVENPSAQRDTRSRMARQPSRAWIMATVGAATIGFAAFCYAWAKEHTVDFGIRSEPSRTMIILVIERLESEVNKHPGNPVLIPVRQEDK